MNKIDEETLWEMMRFLYPNISLDDFYQTLELDGWYDTLTRIKINLKWRYKLIDKYGGDGLSRYRRLYKYFQSEEYKNKIQNEKEQKKRLKNLV